jgi:hypothetical protein
MSTITPDRRILKAFYTQYVAVLLIVLVFVISGFQSPALRVESVAVRTSGPKDVPIGAISIPLPQNSNEKLSANRLPQLDAVAEFVRNHDVCATFRLPIRKQLSRDAASALSASVTRAAELRDYMHELGVPPNAIRTVLFEAPESAEELTVSFSSMEGDHEQQ